MSPYSRSHFFLGLAIIIIGVLILLDNLDIAETMNVWRFWPVLIIALGLARTTGAVGSVGRLIGLGITAIGALLLLRSYDILYFHIWDWWPLVLVLVGVSLLVGTRSRTAAPSDAVPGRYVSTDSIISLFAFWSGFKRTVTTDDFRGGDLMAIMGGCDVDLRQASMKTSPATISVFAFWGGITIRVPTDWSVTIQGLPLMGGFDDKTKSNQAGTEKRLIVTGQAIMGGVDITN